MFNLSSLWAGIRPSSTASADSLDAFAPETPFARAAALRRWRLNAGGASACFLVIAIAGVIHLYRTSGEAPGLAGLTIQSDPPGALVLLHGMPKGVTPLTLTVPPGEHPVTLEYDRMQRTLRVTATAGDSVVHHVQLDRPPAPKGDSAAAAAPRAAAPAPQPSASAGPVGGWISVDSAIPLQVIENDQVVGTTASERIMLPAGTRTLRFVNEPLGYSARRTVQVGPGKTTSVTIAVPRAPLSINAVPWAEVWVDGVRIGETPIGNHMLPLGNHEVVLRHPELGERRHVATVSAKGPSRVSVDLRKVP